MSVSPPKETGVSGWQAVLPQGGEFPVLTENITADWVIVGAGWAGLAAARKLLHYAPKDKIVILDAMGIAESPAGRNSGFMIDLPHDLGSGGYASELEKDRLTIAQNRSAIAYAREALEEFDLPPGIMQPIGKINASASDRGDVHNRELARHLDHLEEPYEMWDADRVRQVTGSGYYRGGLLMPGCTLVQPAQYIQGVAQGIARHCALYTHSPVVNYAPGSNGWKIQTAKGSVSAGKVILAVNGHLQRFGFYTRHLMHVFTYAAMTEPLPEGALQGDKNWGITAAHPMGTSVRRYSDLGDSRVVIRHRFTYDATLEVSEGRLRRVAQTIRRHFEARFPHLAAVKFEYLWAGRLCLAKNGGQVIEELAPNLYAACCQNGLGTTRGTFAGMALVERLMHGNAEYLGAGSSILRPNRLPPEPLASFGANMLLRFRHWQAGRE